MLIVLLSPTITADGTTAYAAGQKSLNYKVQPIASQSGGSYDSGGSKASTWTCPYNGMYAFGAGGRSGGQGAMSVNITVSHNSGTITAFNEYQTVMGAIGNFVEPSQGDVVTIKSSSSNYWDAIVFVAMVYA